MSTEATRTNEARLRAALEACPSALIMTDRAGRIVLLNREVEALFGYAREELLGQVVEVLVPEGARAIHPLHRAAFLADPRVRRMAIGSELRGRHKSGAEIPLEISLTPIVTDEGLFVLSSIVDLRERRKAEERFQVAVESSPNGMIMVDGDGKILMANREIERLFGWSRNELLGKSVEILVPQRFQAAHPEQRARFLAQPHRRAMGEGRELHGLRRDGTEIPIEIGLNPIELDGHVVVLASIVDITARKRAELEQRRLEDQLQQAQKLEAIARLASGIAHDFNNLLMGIIGCAGLAKRSLEPDHPAVQTLDDITEAARRGAGLTRDLLDFSRRKPIDVHSSELNEVVRVAGRMLRQVIGEDIELAIELCPNGGPILANPTHIEHVLLNLAVNARDAMPRGGRLRIATVEIEAKTPRRTRSGELAPGTYVALEVQDSGTGMSEETQTRIFEPFFTTKPVGMGTGLGLYTVYSIVGRLSGGIELESEVGRGTLFRILFPKRAVQLAGAPAAVAEKPVTLPAAHTGRILVVEDERLIRVTLRHTLTTLGYDVLMAEDGRKALETARACPGEIDLVLSDIVLPDASGPEIVDVLQKERPTLRALFMSAYSTDLLVQQGRVKPGTKTLEKPFDEHVLARTVRAALSTTTATT
ncbi:MAG: PAS domain S-box protein [Planctomycetes bacterium]|nr:PAS domain S-box protein [Planctomycetota bacterium]